MTKPAEGLHAVGQRSPSSGGAGVDVFTDWVYHRAWMMVVLFNLCYNYREILIQCHTSCKMNDDQTEHQYVDWRPPAGGDEKLMAILERMKG
ncbi:MAG: hypothetical protein SXV54_27590 [Chloroflexota bacterium]|nr:hypothetical protein [Chloroflexota bacterium]